METAEKELNSITGQQEVKKDSIEFKVMKYIQLKEMIKEQNEQVKMLWEDIEETFEEMNGNELIIQLASEEYAKLHKKVRIKETLDKEALAQHIQISKDELKTPWDFSMLTKQEKITPKMITEYTMTETIVKPKLTKLKRKPKQKKKQS